MDKKSTVEEKSTKFDECVDKGTAVIEPTETAVKKFFTEKVPEGASKVWAVTKKVAPIALAGAVCFFAGSLFGNRPMGMSDEELADAGVKLDGQTPSADSDPSDPC